METNRVSDTKQDIALVLSVVLVVSVLAGGTLSRGVGASSVENVTISVPDNRTTPSSQNVPVAGLESQSEDAVINNHGGTTGAEPGDPVGAFGGDAYYFDADGSADYSAGDEVVLDNDADATYTASRDTLISGLPTGSAVTTTDGFDADWLLDSFDADDTDGAFDAGEDAIVIESGSGGTYSAGADTVLNPGQFGDVDVTAGATLRSTTDISGNASGPHLVDGNGNGEFDAGEDVVSDDDEDDQFTAQADARLDANAGSGTNDPALATFDAPASASMTGAEVVSIPAGGSAPSNGNGLYYVDSDDSDDYTTSDELVLDPNAGSAGSLTYDADGASDEDGDGVAGDDVLLFKGDDYSNNANEGDTLHRFTASDHVAFEDSGHDGIDDGEYQEGEEIYVDYNDGGTVSTRPDTLLNQGAANDRSAGDGLVALNGLDSPSNIRWYDEDGNDSYDSGDEIIVDEDDDGVYTGSGDTLVAGTAPSAGVSLSTGQDGDWSIDAHDAVDGNDWERTTDGLFVDGGDGAYSTNDTLVAGERVPGGTNVTTADGFDGDWSLDSFDDDDTDGAFDAGEDAVVYESRDNGEYTASTDTVLNFGSDDDVDSPAGTTVEPMSAIASDQYLADSNGNGEFDPGEDTVCCDQDQDGQFTDRADTVVDTDGATSATDYGTTADADLGDPVTGAETVSIPAGGADAGNELYYIDSDDSGDYTPTDEVVLDASANYADSLTLDADGASDEDGDGVAGDDAILVHGSDDTNGANEGDTLRQFQASDNVAFENTGTETGHSADGQYQNGEDIVVDYYDGGTISFDYALDTVTNDGGDQEVSGGDPLIGLDSLSTPSGIGWLDEDGSNDYSLGDEIIVDDDSDGAYTANTDLIIGGTPPAPGTSLTTGQDTDWSIDSHDERDGGPWNGTTDALFVDKNDGGTFSATADTQLNAGKDGTFSVSGGDTVLPLNKSTYGYVDTDGKGLDRGDEVYEEGDASSPSAPSVYGDELTKLTVKQVGTLDTQHIGSIDLYRDDGDGMLDPATDTVVQTDATRTDSSYTFDGISQPLGTNQTTYFVTADLASDTPEGETLEFEVPTGGIGFTQGTDVGNLSWNAIETTTSEEGEEGGEGTSANDVSYTTAENRTLSVPAQGVLANDDDPEGSSLTASLVTDVSHGTLDLNPNGSFKYTPDPGFTGTDSFTYQTTDGNGGTDQATVTISVTGGCIDRRNLGRGEQDRACPSDHSLSRGESRNPGNSTHETDRRDMGR